MNTIKLNNVEMQVESYSKSTYLNNNTISSNANCNVITSDITALNELMQAPIEAIQIYHDDTLIYDLDEINARIDNTNEYLSGDHMNISINLTFLPAGEEPADESEEVNEP